MAASDYMFKFPKCALLVYCQFDVSLLLVSLCCLNHRMSSDHKFIHIKLYKKCVFLNHTQSIEIKVVECSFMSLYLNYFVGFLLFL